MIAQICIKDIIHCASGAPPILIIMRRTRDPRSVHHYTSLPTWVLIPQDETRKDRDHVSAIVDTGEVGVVVDVLCECPVSYPRCSVSDGMNGNIGNEAREVQAIQNGDSGTERVSDSGHFAVGGLG